MISSLIKKVQAWPDNKKDRARATVVALFVVAVMLMILLLFSDYSDENVWIPPVILVFVGSILSYIVARSIYPPEDD